jgi:hypothetical protein
MAFLSDVGYLNRRVDVYSPRAFCRGPMLRLNIKAAGNSDGHWSSETPGAGKEHHAETRCSILVPKTFNPAGSCNPNTQLKAPWGGGIIWGSFPVNLTKGRSGPSSLHRWIKEQLDDGRQDAIYVRILTARALVDQARRSWYLIMCGEY